MSLANSWILSSTLSSIYAYYAKHHVTTQYSTIGFDMMQYSVSYIVNLGSKQFTTVQNSSKQCKPVQNMQNSSKHAKQFKTVQNSNTADTCECPLLIHL